METGKLLVSRVGIITGNLFTMIVEYGNRVSLDKIKARLIQLNRTRQLELILLLGCLLTTGALSYGMYQMKTGDRVMSQRMMRLRVLAQGFTVMALLAGVYYASMKAKDSNKKT